MTVAGVIGMTADSDDELESTAIARLREHLTRGLGFAECDVDAAVERAVKQFVGVPIRDFVPVLVERLVLADLKDTTGRVTTGSLTYVSVAGEMEPNAKNSLHRQVEGSDDDRSS